jgi:type III secretory pathway lipoprotein EscJ
MNIYQRLAVGDKFLKNSSRALSSEARTRRFLRIGVFLIPAIFMTSCGETTSLATVSTEAEAIEILNVLHENGMDAHKEEAGEEGVKQWRIVLDQSWFGGAGEVAMANQVLQDNGLPRPTDSAVHPTSDSGMFKDEATRKAEQLKEREADLQRKLRMLPGVIGVEVSIVEPEDSSININPYPSTASVLIVSKDAPPSFDPGTVQGLVARSIPKLNPESVYVAITTKPVRALLWREAGIQRRRKIFDAIGIGLLIVLASSVVVLLLQLRRQSNEIAELREGKSTELQDGEESQNQAASMLAEPQDRKLPVASST